MSSGARPPLSTREALERLHQLLDARREPVEAAIAEATRNVPRLAQSQRQVTPAAASEDRRETQALERGALVESSWDPYLKHLRSQGERYAQLGLEVADWFALLTATRRALLDGLDFEPSVREAVDALHGFQDVSYVAIGSEYSASKERQAGIAEARLALFVDVVKHARAGVLVYHWDEPPDPGSLRLVIQNTASGRLGSTPVQIDTTIRESSPALLETPVAGYYVESYLTQEPRSWTIDWPFPDGRMVNYEANCYPLGTEHLVVFFDDVSEKRRAERDLAHHARELERSNRELDDFAYVASHDLKSPLRDIHNLASWISDDLGTAIPDGTQRHLGLLKDRVGRMETLLDDLLQYSRAGKSEAKPEVLELATVVSSVVGLLDPRGYAVEQRGSLTHVYAPRAGLELVVRNLIANAIGHHDRPTGLIVVSAEPAGAGWTYIEVSDDGPGIPKEHHERAFRMFQTLAAPEIRRGSGMGLAVVRKVVEAHGGRVELISEGRGTTVRMRWPAKRTT